MGITYKGIFRAYALQITQRCDKGILSEEIASRYCLKLLEWEAVAVKKGLESHTKTERMYNELLKRK